MKKVSNWQINVSIFLIIIGVVFNLISFFYSFVGINVDVYDFVAEFLGVVIGSYFIGYIPIKIMSQYKRGNTNEKK